MFMLRRSLLAAPMVLAASAARADWVPKQPIHIIVGFAPGGTADIAARIAAEAIQKRAGHIVVVDSKTGALGYIALKSVANALPDGYTVGIGIMGSLSVGPVVPGTQIPMALIVRPNAPYKTIPELVEYAKANPGKVSYGSTGAGSTNQLGAELFAAEAGGLKLLHVPYRGGAPAIQDLAAGQIDIFFANVSEIVGQINSGQVRALGLASSRPNPMVPDLPLMTKDIPTLEINNWFGLVGPAGLPADIAASLTKLFLDAINDPASKPVLDSRGLVAVPQDGPQFKAQIMKDRERWARVVKAGNIKAE
ncbi:MAG: tripartite tricarboxylate transporter substrate binding protein [Alphaproteobacteria bacterium]|nr:MAG: tripartite tricarboxylate transporter substrate binding protein [Alphaproteobacteria bacterium]